MPQRVCSSLWHTCATSFERLKTNTLPSRRRFHARVSECNATLVPCVGPAAEETRGKLAQVATSGAREYGEAFQQRVSHLLVLVCVSGIVIFRYAHVNGAAELGCWLLLICGGAPPPQRRLELLGAGRRRQRQGGIAPSFWDTPTGGALLEAYEAVVFNEYVDMDDWLQVCMVLVGMVVRPRVPPLLLPPLLRQGGRQRRAAAAAGGLIPALLTGVAAQ